MCFLDFYRFDNNKLNKIYRLRLRCKYILDSLNIDLEINGTLDHDVNIYIVNHLSFLDIFMVKSCFYF